MRVETKNACALNRCRWARARLGRHGPQLYSALFDFFCDLVRSPTAGAAFAGGTTDVSSLSSWPSPDASTCPLPLNRSESSAGAAAAAAARGPPAPAPRTSAPLSLRLVVHVAAVAFAGLLLDGNLNS